MFPFSTHCFLQALFGGENRRRYANINCRIFR
nr:MAG TPA: hypothetical protein [Caudoviricetes sp.]